MIERIHTQRPLVWRIVRACLIGFLVGEVVAMGIQTLLAAVTQYPGGIRGLSTAAAQPWWANVGGMLGIWSGMVGAVVWVHRSGLLSWRTAGWRSFRLGDLRYVVAGGVIQILVDLAYVPIRASSLNAPVHRLFGATHGIGFLLIVLGATIGAPIVEEYFFRATLFRALANAWTPRFGARGTWVAIVVSALIFGLGHGEWLQLPGLVLAGVALAWVYQRTQRVVCSIAMHIGFNSVPVLVILAQRMHA